MADYNTGVVFDVSQYWDLYISAEYGVNVCTMVNGETIDCFQSHQEGNIRHETYEVPDGASVKLTLDPQDGYELSGSYDTEFTMTGYKYINVGTDVGGGGEDYYTLTLTVRNTDYGGVGTPVIIYENGNHVDEANTTTGEHEDTRNFNISAGSTVKLLPRIFTDWELVQGEKRTFAMDSNKNFTYEWGERPEPYGNPWGLTDSQWYLCSTGIQEMLRNPPVAYIENLVWFDGGWGNFSARLTGPNLGWYEGGYYARQVANLIKAGGTERIKSVLFENPWSETTIPVLSYQDIMDEYS